MRKREFYTTGQNMLFLLAAVWKYQRRLILNAIVYAIVKAVESFALLYFPKWILDVLLGRLSTDLLIWLFLGFAAVGILPFFSRMLYNKGFAMIIQLRFILLESHQSACLSVDYEKMEAEDFENRVYSAMRGVMNNTTGAEGVLHRLYEWPGYLAALVVSIYALMQANVVLCLAALVVTTVNYALGQRAAARKGKSQKQLSDTERKARYYSNIMKDRETAKEVRLPLVRAFLFERYDELRAQLAGLKRRQGTIDLNADLVSDVIDAIKKALVYGYLAMNVYFQHITLSAMTISIGAMEELSGIISALLKDQRFIKDQDHSISEFRNFVEENDRAMAQAEGGTPIHRIETIEFNHVYYKYANATEYALKDVCVTINRGQQLAIVGENGAGKTTFIKLLLGLYTPSSGVILVNGEPLGSIRREDYRRNISALFQDFHILAFSVAENIALSEQDIDASRARDALQKVGMLERVDALPKGIDTAVTHKIEDGGVEMSGGEAQRLALSRALYRHADMYVLDEPSAALDPVAESNMYDMIANSMAQNTTIFVSHRLASTRFCDEILFFDKGVIAQRGTHEALMRRRGGYAALYEAQANFYRS